MPEQDPIGTVVQCHKCHKRLKYTGKKSYITCPGCGESVPVVDNIQEGESIELPPPVQSNKCDPKTEKMEGDDIKLWLKEIVVWLIEIVTVTTKRILEMPRFPVILTGIWLVWLVFCLTVYLLAWSKASTFGDYLMVGGQMYGRGEWTWVCLQLMAYFGAAGVVVATIGSVLAYIWTQALQKNST